MTKNKKIKINWLLVAILALLIVVPSSTFIKIVSGEINPYLVAMLRYGIVTIVTLPFLIRAIRTHGKLLRKMLPIIIGASVLGCISGPLHAASIASSSASFIEVIGLSAPIVFCIVSILITRDKLSRYAVAGFLFAVLGGLAIVALPVLLGSGAIIAFGWEPAALQMVVIVLGAISLVYLRKMNEKGLPLTPLISIGFMAAFLASIPLAIMDAGPTVFLEIGNLSVSSWVMLAYLAIAISVISRALRVKSYENLGTATYASMEYLYYLLAIITPILVLGESLSWEMILGAILIIIGIISTRKHQHKSVPTRRKKLKK